MDCRAPPCSRYLRIRHGCPHRAEDAASPPLQVALGMGSLAWAYPIDEVETTSSAGLVLPVEATDRRGPNDRWDGS